MCVGVLECVCVCVFECLCVRACECVTVMFMLLKRSELL